MVAAPQAGADDDVVGGNVAAAGFDADDAVVLDVEAFRGGVGPGLRLAGFHRFVDENADHGLRTRFDQAGVGVPHRALDHVFLEQREFLLGFGGADHFYAGAEGLARSDLALQLHHAVVVADARHFETAATLVVAELVVELDAVVRGVAGELAVVGGVTEVGGVRGRAAIGRYRGHVDADDVVPAAFDQVMHYRGADDTAESDDDDVGFIWKLSHEYSPGSACLARAKK